MKSPHNSSLNWPILADDLLNVWTPLAITAATAVLISHITDHHFSATFFDVLLGAELIRRSRREQQGYDNTSTKHQENAVQTSPSSMR